MGITKRAKFLLSADLTDANERIGRRKRARLNEERGDVDELAAEKRPRNQQKWTDERRKQTKLPTKDGYDADQGGESRPAVPDAPVEGGMGKKKQKRMAVIQAKTARKEQKKAAAKFRDSAKEVEEMQGKIKPGQLSQAASELLEKHLGKPEAEKRLLAVVAERIAGAPEKEVELFDIFFQLHTKSADKRTRQLALLSAVAVFRDLVPGYRIREQTEQEKSVVRSKPVIALERYEQAILQRYRQLLPLLETAMKKEPIVFAAALSALLQAASEFNYRQRLIATAVRHAGSSIASVRQEVAEGLRGMIEADRRLESSREVVLAVGRVAQSAAKDVGRGGGRGGHSGLNHELVEVLLRLPIGKAEDAALQEAGLDGNADDEVRKGLNEASISQGADKVQKAEAELLTEVFVVYLRILRQRQVHGRELLASVLTGLSRWGQQVNIELLLEILVELRGAVKDAMDRGDELVALQGLNCALVLLSGPSQALMTDVTWLADALKMGLNFAVSSLHSTHSEASSWPPPRCFSMEETDDGKQQRLCICSKELNRALEADSVPALVLRCLEAALKCPQAYGRASDAALATLIEQLFVLALTADSHVALPLLKQAAFLLRKHRQLYTLLDAEGGLFGLGGIQDHSVSVVWHLQPLAFSLVPEVRKVGRELAGVIPSPRGSLKDLFPSKDGLAWLSTEVGRHLGGCLADPALAPRQMAGSKHGGTAAFAVASPRRPKTAAFLSEAELVSACDALARF
eukprot:TRINITY_DN12613_c0_g3_i1.p1 TRINITY_DN12613_c0_g3~~TRINITY_DN12613_c0_g3_i1.p1  ORF type:complete len:746 (+),score=148.64 TRINITY_DN12613_c0_g3_i1:157-2394(+)